MVYSSYYDIYFVCYLDKESYGFDQLFGDGGYSIDLISFWCYYDGIKPEPPKDYTIIKSKDIIDDMIDNGLDFSFN